MWEGEAVRFSGLRRRLLGLPMQIRAVLFWFFSRRLEGVSSSSIHVTGLQSDRHSQ